MTLSGRTKVLSQTLGDRVPRSGVRAASIWRSPASLAGGSGCHGGQLEDRILAQWSDGFQRHVAGALHGPLIVLLEQDCTDQAGDGSLVGEDADDFGATWPTQMPRVAPENRPSVTSATASPICWP